MEKGVKSDKKKAEGFVKEQEKEIIEPAQANEQEKKEEVITPIEAKKENKQIMWIIILMISVILILVLVPYLNNKFFNKFNYVNLDFEKTKTGKVVFYSAKVPLTKTLPITGAFIGEDRITGRFNMNFRNDPRKLDYIPVDIANNTILFKGNIVYITMNPEDKPCEQNVISVVSLTSFLIEFASMTVKGAVTDKAYADENKIPYITCNNSLGNTVIYIKEGKETSIKKTNPLCYELTYNNCEMLPVSEKFILTVLEGYMSFFKGGENLKRPVLPGENLKIS